MKYLRNILMITAILFFAVSCEDFSLDLDVPNYEHPNDDILTSDPVALTATAGGLLNNWYMTVHDYWGPCMMMQTMADVSTCSWGNVGMNDMSSEPRSAWNNLPSYGYQDATNGYFNALYSVLSDANTIVAAAEKGTEFDNPDLVKMMGKVGQAFSIGYLALVFDRVWLSDEKGNVTEDGSSSTYKEAMAFALEKLDDAIAIAKANSITVPDTWLPGGGGEAGKFLAFLNSMGARMMVSNVRNSAQKAEINWDKVLTYTDNGLTEDFTIFMDDVVWYDLAPKTYLVYPSWGRTDMYVVNLMDPNTPAYWPEGEVTLPESTSDDARLKSDYEYMSSQNFNPTRGTYHYSTYRYAALDYYISEWVTDVVEYTASENEMYMAEAYLHKNDVAKAAEIVNQGTRTTRGGLDPVGADASAVYDAIHYERCVEFAYTGMSLSFFEMRKEDLLQKGTPLHFPVPGKALEAIPEENYTYGGTTGVAGEDYSTGGWR
jgi:starch-binding outer membrane protein, SusD/RagB family